MPRSASGQFTECPFDGTLSEADTLDAAGYFPLEVGNAWEHLVWSGCCLNHAVRREVVGDTLVGDQSYQILSESNSQFVEGEGNPLDSTTVFARETMRHYLAVRDGWLVEWTSGAGEQERVQLGAPFQSCYADPSTGDLAVVWALSPTSFDMKKTGASAFDPPAGKAVDVAGAQSFYQHGVGFVSGSHADTAIVLTYARIGGLEYGEPMGHLFVAAEDPPETPVETDFKLSAYPNPFSGRATVELVVPRAGAVRVRVVDLLGRTVGRLLENDSATEGRHVLQWIATGLASGIYFIQVFHNNRLVLTERLILAK